VQGHHHQRYLSTSVHSKKHPFHQLGGRSALSPHVTVALIPDSLTFQSTTASQRCRLLSLSGLQVGSPPVPLLSRVQRQ
jgi:hypothetical protein